MCGNADRVIDEMTDEIADLRTKLQQAETARDKLRRHNKEAQDVAIAERREKKKVQARLIKAQVERDAAIERHRQDAGRAWHLYNIAMLIAQIMQNRAEAAEGDDA